MNALKPCAEKLQFQNMNTKKRKDIEDSYNHFTSFPIPIPPSTKSRRLDHELYAIIEEEDRDHNVTVMEPTPNEEKSLVIYQPTDIVKSHISTDFSIIVKSDLIPGLKDYLLSWGITKPYNSVEDEMGEKNSEVSNDCLAVVPWVAYRPPMASEEIVPESGQPLEDKQDEMMELDEPYANDNNENPMEISEMVEAAGTSSSLWQQQRRQHCMMVNHSQNTSTPIHWCYHS
ncbi:PREDICTED: uncharacterized protein LOC109327198 isoform X1 [Lupinus angustifolius]|uniref:uncharacterized protein LOC109327198 isoform X1 n=1 Tax=Lupinus angustifolius TaxID=3871 RepID=UPI00092EDAEA|nr:PREDICTED: uncharacterized protein LOC109327198 isoform X1 [Lupinus angustifolius]